MAAPGPASRLVRMAGNSPGKRASTILPLTERIVPSRRRRAAAGLRYAIGDVIAVSIVEVSLDLNEAA